MNPIVRLGAVATWIASMNHLACDLGRARTEVSPVVKKDIAAVEERVKKNPGDVEALLQAGALYEKTERWFDAADAYLRARDAATLDARAYLRLSDVYTKLGYFHEAYSTLDRCTRTAKGNEDCLFRLARLLVDDGSSTGVTMARQLLERFVATASEHPRLLEAQEILQRLPAKSETPESPHAGGSPSVPSNPHESPTLPGHTTQPPDADVGQLNEFGMLLKAGFDAVRRNDLVTAESAFLNAAKMRPEDPSAHVFLAQVLLRAGKESDALSAAERSFALEPGGPEARYLVGLLLIRLDRDVVRGLGLLKDLAGERADLVAELGLDSVIRDGEKKIAESKSPRPQTP